MRVRCRTRQTRALGTLDRQPGASADEAVGGDEVIKQDRPALTSELIDDLQQLHLVGPRIVWSNSPAPTRLSVWPVSSPRHESDPGQPSLFFGYDPGRGAFVPPQPPNPLVDLVAVGARRWVTARPSPISGDAWPTPSGDHRFLLRHQSVLGLWDIRAARPLDRRSVLRPRSRFGPSWRRPVPDWGSEISPEPS